MFRGCTALVLLVLASEPLRFQTRLSEEDVSQVIAHYKKFRLASVKMPPPTTDSIFRASVHSRLPQLKALSNHEMFAALKRVLDPVLTLYHREDVYDIVIVESPTPLMMSDSGVALLITTGMIQRSQSDDELLGYVAHEVGHEYFAKYSIYSKYLLSLVGTNGNEPALRNHTVQILALIELQCDIFAAFTLSSLGYEPLEFVRGMERTRRDFPKQTGDHHPPDFQRSYVVKELATVRVKPRQSEALKHLKMLLDARTRD